MSRRKVAPLGCHFSGAEGLLHPLDKDVVFTYSSHVPHKNFTETSQVLFGNSASFAINRKWSSKMKTENMKPENSKDESVENDNVLELFLLVVLAGLMGLAS